MTLSDINSKISFLTSSDTSAGGYANSDRVININNYYNRILTGILQSQDEWDFDDISITTSYPLAKRDLVANQQDYKFSSAASISPFKVKRVEVSYDGNTWNKAEPFDNGQTSKDSSQLTINNLYQTSRPYYDLQWNSLFLYPIPIVNQIKSLKVWFDRQITEYTTSDLTTGTKVPGFDANFHMILAYGAAYEFAIANGKANLDETKKELEQLMLEMRQHYGSKDKDRVWMLKPEPIIYS